MGVVNNKIALMGLEANTAGLMTSVANIALTVEDVEETNTVLTTALSENWMLKDGLRTVQHTGTADTVEHNIAAFMTKLINDIGTLANDEALYFTQFCIDEYEMMPIANSNKLVNNSTLNSYLDALRVGGFAKIVLSGTAIQIVTAMARLSRSSGYYAVSIESSDSSQNAFVKHLSTDSLTAGKKFEASYYKLKQVVIPTT